MPQTVPSGTLPEDAENTAHSRLLTAALASTPDYVYAFDRQRRLAYANPAMLKLFGLSAEKMLGRTFADLDYPEELAKRLDAHIDRVLSDGVTIEEEVYFRATTGHDAYFWFLWSPVLGLDGSIELVVGISRETTQRRATEVELARSDAQFRSFAKHSNSLIWIGDPVAGTIIFRSTAFERIWGVSCSGGPVAITDWMKDVHSDDRGQVQQALSSVTGGEVVQFEYRIIRPVDGNVRRLRDMSFPIFDESGAVTRIGGITEDLTQEYVDQVYIVSDMGIEALRLAALVRATGRKVRVFASAAVFLDVAAILTQGCVFVDLRSRREEGLSLLRALRVQAAALPALALDLPSGGAAAAVAAMKAGAIDYLIMTEDDASLRSAMAGAISENCNPVRQGTLNDELGAQASGLTPREREAFIGLIAGGTNKTIGQQLGISPRTVELHRAQIMKRLNASSLAELLRIGLRAGLAPIGERHD